jgi:4,5-dihydroxyphthalate decarboxylase
VCNDDGHLAEFKDPPNVERTPPDSKKVDQMLLDGEIDGAILGAEIPNEPRVAHLIPNPKDAALAWYRKYNTVPVNHLFCLDKDLADARPDVVVEIFRMLKATKAAMPPSADGIDFHPFGVEALRKPLSMIIRYSVEQKIIPREIAVDELFDDVTRGLA